MARPKRFSETSTDGSRRHRSKIENEEREQVVNAQRNDDELKVPKYLSKRAKKIWKELVKVFRNSKYDMVSDLDKPAFAIFCTAFAMWQDDVALLDSWQDRLQDILDDYLQETQQDPYKTTMAYLKLQDSIQKNSKLALDSMEKLGLTPYGREKIGWKKLKEDGDQAMLKLQKLIAGEADVGDEEAEK